MATDQFIDVIILADEAHRRYIQNKLDRAIAILRSIVEDGLDPHITNDYAVTYCYFCIEDSPNHKADCPYLLAQQLLNEINDD